MDNQASNPFLTPCATSEAAAEAVDDFQNAVVGVLHGSLPFLTPSN